MTPLPPEDLLQEGQEWWGRYPSEFKKDFCKEAQLGPLHSRMLKQHYFPVYGSVPKSFVAKNRRHLDMNVARYEADSERSVDRSAWGLPEPNREAAYISLAKYAKDIPFLTPKQVNALNNSFNWMERHFGPYMQNSRVKSLEETWAGVDKTTSPGFPWTRKYATKRAMYDDWKEFPQYMEDDWDRLQSERYTAVFGNSLKEEIRPAEKIAVNSIRTFTAGPVEMTIHGNRLFEDMNQKFYASHLQTASVVGFSPLKGGWNDLYLKLKRFRNGFALDESQYDSSLRAYMMWACAEFRWRMLRQEDQTEENLSRLRNYYANLVNTMIITSDGVFIRKQGGNPSGSVNTISDNTLILYILLAYGWNMIAPEGFACYEAFEDNLALALCGDDNTWTVSDEAVKFFNARSVIKEWAELGVTTTTDSLDPRPLEQLDFLSAHTTFKDGVAVPLYNREKLLTSLLYSRFPDDPVYTLLRATALLRVAWVDERMRAYLRDLCQWLIAEYGPVLQNDPSWRGVLHQVPTEPELYELFLGKDNMLLQFQGMRERLESLGKFDPGMEVIALPQRQRRKRAAAMQWQPKRRQIGPVMASGAFRAGGTRRQPRKRQGGRKRRGRKNRRGGGGRPGGGGAVSRVRVNMRGAEGRNVFSGEEVINSTVLGVVATGVIQFALNPGQVATFPILSQRAKVFEKYVFTRLEFEYATKVNQFAANGVGTVVLGFDPDASDPPPSSLTNALNAKPRVFGAPYENFKIEVAGSIPHKDWYFVRPGNLPGAADIKEYDVGVLNLTVDSTVNTNAIGILTVRYAGFFMNQTPGPVGAPTNNSVSWFSDNSSETLTTAVATTLLLATAKANGLNVVNTSGSFVPPAGNYLFDYYVVGKDNAAEAYQLTTDFQKNGTSVASTNKPIFTTGVSLGATEGDTVSASGFFQANGTDAFTLVVTMTGAAGVLTASGSLRFIAI